MSVYGNFIYDNIEEKAMSMIDFASYIEECDNRIFGMFNNLGILNEVENELSIPTQIEFNKDPEKAKKTIIQTIKELIAKFIATVKKLFITISEKIHEAYVKISFVDKFVSIYKDKVTYNNLQKALSNGWKGLLVGQYKVINRIANPSDSKIYQNLHSVFEFDKEIDINDIDAIISANSLEASKEKYDKFKEKLLAFKNSTEKEDPIYYIYDNVINAEKTGYNDNLFFGCFGQPTDEDGKYYMPYRVHFEKTKSFAENGESNIKQLKHGYNRSIKCLNLNKKIELSNWKSFEKGGANYSKEDATQINALYCKARYELASAIIKRSSKVLNAVVETVKSEHKIAIATYIQFVHAIIKHVKFE